MKTFDAKNRKKNINLSKAKNFLHLQTKKKERLKIIFTLKVAEYITVAILLPSVASEIEDAGASRRETLARAADPLVNVVTRGGIKGDLRPGKHTCWLPFAFVARYFAPIIIVCRP